MSSPIGLPTVSYIEIQEDSNGVLTIAYQEDGKKQDVRGHYYRINYGCTAVDLKFQFGPVKENGVNGITSEALLAILMDRTKTMNSQIPSKYNEKALAMMTVALKAFEDRTAERIAHNVEGTEQDVDQ